MPRALAFRYLPVTITTPPGTLIAAPHVTPIDLGDVQLVLLHLRIPPGHSGLTGIRVDYSGATILPWSNPPTFLVGDDDHNDFEVGFEVDRTLSAVTYNLDVYPHTHYLLCKVADLTPSPVEPLTLVPVTPAAGT